MCSKKTRRRWNRTTGTLIPHGFEIQALNPQSSSAQKLAGCEDRTHDLWIMRPTLYQLSQPSIIGRSKFGRVVKALALGASLERGTGSNPVACIFYVGCQKWKKQNMTPEGIEPPIFGSGIRRVTIAPWSHLITHNVKLLESELAQRFSALGS